MADESVNAREAKQAIKRANRSVVGVIVAAAVVVAGCVLGNLAWTDHQIARNTQKTDCAIRTLDNAIYDAGLLAKRDANIHDYRATPKC